MEDIRDAVYNQIDIVITRDYAIIDMLTKIEIQAKILSLNIIAPESYMTVLRLPKKDLIEFILGLNLYYTEEDEDNISETHEEMNDMDENHEEMNDMDENHEGVNDGQHNRYGTNNFYNHYGGMNNYQQYWQYNQNQHYYPDQDQEYWQQWNG